ncbi:MAG: hypothetical protein KC646_10875 [Candidatus Cloacimonetes bacterium]|nr:hypothetical protein [Candidatus Cloacimonadota bacterium]
MIVEDRLHRFWTDFGAKYFDSSKVDLFVSGLALYSPIWLKEPVDCIRLMYVGSVKDLQEAVFCHSWESSVSSENRLILRGRFSDLVLEFQIFDSIDLLFQFNETRAINYERVCFSFRQGRFIDDFTIEKPTQMKCDRPLSFDSKKDLFHLSLSKKLRLELLIPAKYLGLIDFEELCHLGVFDWVENQVFVSFLLDDLYHLDVLTPESKSFVLSLTSILGWIEQNYTRVLTFFETKLLSFDNVPHSSLEFPYKKYLIYTSQTKFVDAFEDVELDFLNEIVGSFEQWIAYLEGNELSFKFLGQWVEKFKGLYLEAFILSCMHIVRIYGDNKMLRHQVAIILQEFLIEDQFVKNLLNKADVTVSEDQFIGLIVMRFNGELKSIQALKTIVG